MPVLVPATQAAGGCAGTISWAVLHPVDVIKSCVQALPDTTPAADRTVAAVARKGFQEEGLRCVVEHGGCRDAFPVWPPAIAQADPCY